MKNKLATTFLAASLAISASAIPAYKGLIARTLPDGTTIEIRLHGDENFHFTTLADGTIVKDVDGYFYYATVGDNGIEATKYKVGQPLPSKAKKYMANDNSIAKKLQSIYDKRRTKRNIPRQNADKGDTPLGSQHGLVILVNFADVEFEYDKEMFENVLNQEGYRDERATGSAYDYFRDSSYGLYSPVFDVLGPYTLSQNQEYYGGNDRNGDDLRVPEMIVEACKLASAAGNDMSQYDYDGDGYIDNVYVFYAGEGEANGGAEDTIWPHRWVVVPGYGGNFDGTLEDTKVDGVYVYDYACSNEICELYRNMINSAFDGVGTFIHEFGHVLDLPDLYNTGYLNTLTLDGYDVMDAGSYLHYSRTPPAYSGYERMFIGWLIPEQIHPSYEGDVMELEPISEQKAYLLTTDGTEHNLDGTNPLPEEFYILEYRDRTGWDKFTGQQYNQYESNALGDKGLLITRISYDKNKWDNNTVNNYSYDMGVSYVCTEGQSHVVSSYYGSYYDYFYPMFPGNSNASSVEFGNYTISDIHYNEDGNVCFTISDKTAEPTMGGIDGKTVYETVAVAGENGRILVKGIVENVRVLNMQGVTMYNGNATEIAVPAGIYIVQIGNGNGAAQTVKVAVR